MQAFSLRVIMVDSRQRLVEPVVGFSTLVDTVVTW